MGPWILLLCRCIYRDNLRKDFFIARNSWFSEHSRIFAMRKISKKHFLKSLLQKIYKTSLWWSTFLNISFNFNNSLTVEYNTDVEGNIFEFIACNYMHVCNNNEEWMISACSIRRLLIKWCWIDFLTCFLLAFYGNIDRAPRAP